PTDGGGVVAGGVFGIDARLDRVALDPDIGLGGGQLFAGSDAQLPFDQVEAGDHLGHRVLDLQAGVHLQEEEPVAVGHEFHGAGADIAHRLGGSDGGGTHGGAA